MTRRAVQLQTLRLWIFPKRCAYVLNQHNRGFSMLSPRDGLHLTKQWNFLTRNGGFHHGGTPRAGGFIMENPIKIIKIWMIGG